MLTLASENQCGMHSCCVSCSQELGIELSDDDGASEDLELPDDDAPKRASAVLTELRNSSHRSMRSASACPYFGTALIGCSEGHSSKGFACVPSIALCIFQERGHLF